MPNKEKVSVIVPVFNYEAYIEKCMDSLLGQTYSNYEVILVDDGSTDSSGQLCDWYAKKSEKVKVIRQENQGVTSARLTGLENADGEFAAFVDVDDWVEEDYIESMVEQIAAADMVACGICRVLSISGSRKERNCLKAGRYDTSDLRKQLYGQMLYYSPPFHFGITPYMCNKLFRLEKILPLFRKADKRIFCGEDAVINCMALLSSHGIVLSDDCKYHYCDHSESAVHRMGENYYLNATYVYQALYQEFSRSGYRDVLLPQLDQYMRFMVWNKMPEGSAIYGYVYFPFQMVERGAKIVLYGAGKFGHIFYQQVSKTGYCEIVAWADQNALELKGKTEPTVIRPEEISRYEYQYVVLAIGEENTAQKITENLIRLGVERDRIVCPDR